MGPEGEDGGKQLRRAFKLRLGAREVQTLCVRLQAEAGPARQVPPTSLITSVYFDTPGLALSTRARRTPGDCLKVRTREYFPDLESLSGRRVVLEVKHESGGRAHKRRLWLERPELASVLENGGGHLPRSAEGLLEAQLAVTFRRRVYQSEERWRVTLDDEIAFHRVTQEQALSPEPLTRLQLPCAFATEPQVVLEVKQRGAVLPPWLAALESQSVEGFSKFAEGMHRLQEERAGAAERGG